MAINKSLTDTLLQQIKTFEDEKPAVAQAYERIVERLTKSQSGKPTLAIGDTLPPFRLPDENGILRTSNDLLSTGPLVVSLNRGHWCKFCQHELRALQAINRDIQNLQSSIVAITPEGQNSAKKLKADRELGFPVMCDVDNAYALLLGLAIWCGEEILLIYANSGIDVGKYQNNREWLLPIPATFVVSQDGKIADCYINADFRARMAPEDILASVRKVV